MKVFRMEAVAIVLLSLAVTSMVPSLALRIDTHQHIIPHFYAAKLKELQQTSGGAVIPPWSPEGTLQFMDDFGIGKSILSVSAPGAYISKDVEEVRKLARQLNDYSHEVQTMHPDKVGFFATLCLPDVEGSVEEAKHALDVLGAHGVILMAHANDIYLGDPSLEPLMEVLNERKAIVFIHPDKLEGPAVKGIPPFVADFLLDTTRAAVNLLLNGATEKYPNIRFIFSHGGGFLPYAAIRVAGSVGVMKKVGTFDILKEMKRFYFDTALAATDMALPSLLAFAPDHLVYGSDFPFASPVAVGRFNAVLARYPGLSSGPSQELLSHVTAEQLFAASSLKPVSYSGDVSSLQPVSSSV